MTLFEVTTGQFGTYLRPVSGNGPNMNISPSIDIPEGVSVVTVNDFDVMGTSARTGKPRLVATAIRAATAAEKTAAGVVTGVLKDFYPEE